MTSKQETIDERKANLPLPEQPPVASDWNSSDARTVNVGSGGAAADISSSELRGGDALRGPSTADSDVRVDGEEYKTNTAGRGAGREGQDNLGGLPNDAVAREAKHKKATVDTSGKDYGYPSKSDPSSGL
jgi:hypothetical protein